MNKEELKEALVKAGRIIDHWERQELDSQEAMELLAAEFGTISLYFELELGDAETKEGDLFSKTEDLKEENEDVKKEEEESKSKKKSKEFAGSNGEIPF